MYNLDHVGVVVKDIDRSERFYCEVLEGSVVGRHDNERLKISFIQIGDGMIELLEYKAMEQERSNRGVVDHIAINVPDINKAVEKAKKLGATMLEDSPRDFGQKKIIFLVGPNQERIEFVQE